MKRRLPRQRPWTYRRWAEEIVRAWARGASFAALGRRMLPRLVKEKRRR